MAIFKLQHAHSCSHRLPYSSNSSMFRQLFQFTIGLLYLQLLSFYIFPFSIHSKAQSTKAQSNVHLPTIDGHTASFVLSSSSSIEPNLPVSTSASPSSPLSSSSCAAPEVLVNGAPSASIGSTVSGPLGLISEIQFVSIVAASREDLPLLQTVRQKRICKIKCLNGLWIGPFCAMQDAEAAYSESIFQSCSVPTIANAIITQVSSHPSEKPYSEINLSDHQQKLPHGSIIRIRCIQVGVYKLTGVHEVTCVDGLWSSALPVCTMTTLHSNFSDVECSPLETLIASEPDTKRIHITSGKKLNDKIQFKCLPGFRIEGSEELTCLANGKWSQQVPKCKGTGKHFK